MNLPSQNRTLKAPERKKAPVQGPGPKRGDGGI